MDWSPGAFRRSFDAVGFLSGGGEMGARVREHPWEESTLGPPVGWPQSLKTTIRIILTSRYPMFVWWGPDLVNLYNDAYIPVLGARHPTALGAPAAAVWSDIWDQIGVRVQRVLLDGEATFDQDLLLVMGRHGYAEETYFTFSYSPIPGDEDGVGGVFCACSEETGRVIGERRLWLLRELALAVAHQRLPLDVCAAAVDCVGRLAGRDIPWGALYLAGSGGDGGMRRLAATSASSRADEAALTAACAAALRGGAPVLVENAATSRGRVLNALATPLRRSDADGFAGCFVGALNPHRPTEEVAEFVKLVANQIAAGVAHAESFAAERRRADALADLDRAKTQFYSNVSHEFRTPLTLMLGPLERALAAPPERFSERRSDLEVAHRNGVLLLRLVNTLLDFSRIEAGHPKAQRRATNLSSLTAELASAFESVCAQAGLTLAIDCPPLPEPVWVDPEMWEQIVLNLVSNAFKHTFEGGIAVRLGVDGECARLEVCDTGVGVPADELPKVFARFHRIEGQRSRSHEGSGIGLALVKDLVTLHGGTVAVESELGVGSRFIVTTPFGAADPSNDRLADGADEDGAPRAAAYVEAAALWLDGGEAPTAAASPSPDAGAVGRPRVVLADDNTDMRRYVVSLLRDAYAVEAVGDGEAALAAINRERPELVVADIMMPRLDGFGLLRAIRADPALNDLPVIFLSARAEEARIAKDDIEADDYVVKPFTSRALLARIRANVQLGRSRRAATASLRASEARYRALVEASSQVVWRTTPDGATVEAVGWDRVTGQPPEESQGWGWLERVHPEDRADAVAAWRRSIREERIHEAEYRVACADGGYRWYAARGAPVRDEDRQILEWIGVCVDIDESKRAMAALKNSEEMLRFALDCARMGYWSAAPQLDRFTASTLAKAMNGLPEDAVLDQETAFSVVHPEDRARVMEQLTAAVHSGSMYEVEYRTARIDGEVRWLAARGRWLDGDGREPQLFGVVEDVTDRKRVEAERERLLSQVEDQLAELEALYDNAPLGLGLFDRDFKVRRINAALAAMNGASAEEHLGRTIFEIVPKLREQTEPVWRRVLDTGLNVLDIEIRGETPAAPGVERVWVEQFYPVRRGDGRIVGVGAIVQEVTAQKEVERELRDSEAKFREIAEAIDDVVYVTDPARQGALYVSPAFERLWGRGAAELEADRLAWLASIEPPEDRARVAAAVEIAHRKGERFDLEYRIVRPDGEERWIHDRAVPVESGEGRRLVGVAADITHRKRAEEHQQLLLRELNHRVKNTLAIVQSIATLTAGGATSVEAFRDAFTARVFALSRAHDLLTHADWKGAALFDILRATLSPFTVRAGDRIRFDGPMVHLGPNAAVTLSMVFHELATNAAKYGALSGPEGSVTIEWGGVPAAAPQALALRWREAGGPHVAAPPRRGFGSRLIERGVPQALGATVALKFLAEGVVCDIEAPLSSFVEIL